METPSQSDVPEDSVHVETDDPIRKIAAHAILTRFQQHIETVSAATNSEHVQQLKDLLAQTSAAIASLPDIDDEALRECRFNSRFTSRYRDPAVQAERDAAV